MFDFAGVEVDFSLTESRLFVLWSTLRRCDESEFCFCGRQEVVCITRICPCAQRTAGDISFDLRVGVCGTLQSGPHTQRPQAEKRSTSGAGAGGVELWREGEQLDAIFSVGLVQHATRAGWSSCYPLVFSPLWCRLGPGRREVKVVSRTGVIGSIRFYDHHASAKFGGPRPREEAGEWRGGWGDGEGSSCITCTS